MLAVPDMNLYNLCLVLFLVMNCTMICTMNLTPQGGSVGVLTSKDVTGLTPPQLALEKGHRYLGMHLAEYKRKQEGGGICGKNGKLAWLTSTQLAPIIVFYVSALVIIFIHQVRCWHTLHFLHAYKLEPSSLGTAHLCCI